MHRIFGLVTIGGAALSVLAVAAITLLSAAPSTVVEATDGYESTAAIAARVKSAAPSGQQSMVADGAVSSSEYAAAVDATVSCAVAGGAPVVVRSGEALAPPSFGFRAATLEQGEVFRAILDGCKAQYFNAVQELWNAAHRPSPEDAERAVDWVAACVARFGMDVPTSGVDATEMAGWTMSNDAGLAAATGQCVHEHYTTFGYWP